MYIYIIDKPPIIKLRMLRRVSTLTTSSSSSNVKWCSAGQTRAFQDKTHSFFYESYFALFFLFSPVPTISWRRADGKQIPRKARRHRSSGLLEIPNFQQEDAGLYECVAENVRGKNVARGQLTFYGKQSVCLQGGLLYQVQYAVNILWGSNLGGILKTTFFYKRHISEKGVIWNKTCLNGTY